MRIRVKFEKTGNVRFLGHLDVMRYFQKAIRRAKIPVTYTKGFSPHQMMSFASPLGVGMEGVGEYFDLEVDSVTSSLEMKNALNACMAEGFSVNSVVLLSDGAMNGMAAVTASDYQIGRGADLAEQDWKSISLALGELMSREEILIDKEGKNGTVSFDIRQGIKSAEYLQNDKLFLLLSSGSRLNVHPKQVMQSLFEMVGLPWTETDIAICRMETYTEKDGKLVTLESEGTLF